MSIDKETLNQETKKILDLLPYDDAALMHDVIAGIADRKGIKWKP